MPVPIGFAVQVYPEGQVATEYRTAVIITIPMINRTTPQITYPRRMLTGRGWRHRTSSSSRIDATGSARRSNLPKVWTRLRSHCEIHPASREGLAQAHLRFH